ncbi:dihydroorotase [Bartonella sp. LJL80]
MSDFDLVLTGRVVDAGRIRNKGYVAVRNGTIERIGEGQPPAAKDRHDFGDAYIMPGAIDSQVHSRSQKGQEDFVWSSRSAAAGGVTTLVDMPYDDGNMICTGERLTQKALEAGDQSRVDFALYGTVSPQDGSAHIRDMVAAGACAFKFSTFGTHPQRFPRIPSKMLFDCFREISKHGLMAGVHNEHDEFIRATEEEIAGSGITDYRAHGLSRPPLAEALATAEVYETGAAAGCSSHIVHSSISRGYDLCRSYRLQGYDTTIEACIHYLVLDEEHDVARLGGKAKINPPVRQRDEVEALWRHLAGGNVTVVSTDHVSWSVDRKTDPVMLKNASGVPGLEVLYTLLLDNLIKRRLSPVFAARLLAANPARLFRIGHQKGALELGRDADIVVMAHNPGRYDPAASGHNYVQWSPYENMELIHRPAATFVRGKMVFDGKNVIAKPGDGVFVKPLQIKQAEC